MIDVIQRIDKLIEKNGLSYYALAAKAGLSSSTIANIHRRNTVPSIATLDAICNAFGITLSEFFSDDESFDVRIDEVANGSGVDQNVVDKLDDISNEVEDLRMRIETIEKYIDSRLI